MREKSIFSLCLLLAASIASVCSALELEEYRIVDLSQTYDADTIYWPTSPTAFEKTELANGFTDDTSDAYFYSAYSVCTPEHGGTHIDSPVHFSEDGIATDEIPLTSLIARAVVIDVSLKAQNNRNYRVSAADIREFERQYGPIEAGSIVLLRTGWSSYWPDTDAYLGDDTPGDASKLEFPGYGADAARILTEERDVAVIGIDTASIDYGKSQDFIAHRIGAAQGVANLENLTNLDQLPSTGSLVMALPMKISGGSGGPVRVVALVPREKNP